MQVVREVMRNRVNGVAADAVRAAMSRRLRAAGAAALLALTGCQHLARVPVVDVVLPTAAVPLPPAPPVVPDPPPPRTGAIFQADLYRPLFEAHRARIVGDTLTVNIIEKVSAVQKSTSSLDRSGTADSSVSALPLLKSTSLAKLKAAATANNKFSGNGTTESSNDFSGTITGTVVQVLANGHLVVSAEKQIGVNANVDVLRFSGQVDPRAIAPGNVVQSSQIANVRVEQRGRGQQAEAQSMGWLGRFFLSVSPI